MGKADLGKNYLLLKKFLRWCHIWDRRTFVIMAAYFETKILNYNTQVWLLNAVKK